MVGWSERVTYDVGTYDEAATSGIIAGGAMRVTIDQALHDARAAYARRDWASARALYDGCDELDVADLAALADACWWLGEVDEYVDHADRVHRQHLAAGRSPRAGLTALEIGFMEFLRGRDDAGQGWLARARRLLEKEPAAPEHGYLLAVEADWAIEAGDEERAEELIGAVLDLADRHDEATLHAQGLFAAGVLAIRRGRMEEAWQRLDEAMLPVQEGRVLPEWTGNLYCRMMQLCHELGDLRRAQRWTEITERWHPDYAPAVIFRGICRVHRVQLLQVHGEWERAEQEARQATTELAELDVAVVAEADYRLGELHRLQGALDEAEDDYRRAHRNGRDPLPGLALVHLRRGRGQVAMSVLDAALASATTPQERAPLLAARVEVALARDDPGLAERLVAELAELARSHDSPCWRADAQRWEGAVLLARDRPAAAVPVLREARRLWQQVDAPYDVARVRLDLAAALEALGDRDSARREQDAAVETLEQLGARQDLARVRARRPADRDPDGLSPRELEIVAAIAAGETNRAAAERLHISERTVARHLANIYLKADVSSRTAAVAWARDRGLL